MARCRHCRREMLKAKSCTVNTVKIDGIDFASLRYGEGTWRDDVPAHPCHDCGVHRGGLHHPGCDMEECPKCHGQLISCGCLDDEDENEDE